MLLVDVAVVHPQGPPLHAEHLEAGRPVECARRGVDGVHAELHLLDAGPGVRLRDGGLEQRSARPRPRASGATYMPQISALWACLRPSIR